MTNTDKPGLTAGCKVQSKIQAEQFYTLLHPGMYPKLHDDGLCTPDSIVRCHLLYADINITSSQKQYTPIADQALFREETLVAAAMSISPSPAQAPWSGTPPVAKHLPTSCSACDRASRRGKGCQLWGMGLIRLRGKQHHHGAVV